MIWVRKRRRCTKANTEIICRRLLENTSFQGSGPCKRFKTLVSDIRDKLFARESSRANYCVCIG